MKAPLKKILLALVIPAFMLSACGGVKETPVPATSTLSTLSTGPAQASPTSPAVIQATEALTTTEIPGMPGLPFTPGQVLTDVPYSSPTAGGSDYLMDIYTPQTPAYVPSAVIFHGGGEPKENYQPLASALASQGSVVFVPNYFTGAPTEGIFLENNGAGVRLILENAACAIRYAHATVRSYGGVLPKIYAIGHSAGGYPAIMTGLLGEGLDSLWDNYAAAHGGPGPQVTCKADATYAARPRAMVGHAGAYLYFEQQKNNNPELYALVTPSSYIGKSEYDVLFYFMWGTKDESLPAFLVEPSRAMFESMLDAGFAVFWLEVDAGHKINKVVIDEILSIIRE